MSVFLRILALIAKYGSKAIDWCWANKTTILRWIERQVAIGTIIDWILDACHIKH